MYQLESIDQSTLIYERSRFYFYLTTIPDNLKFESSTAHTSCCHVKGNEEFYKKPNNLYFEQMKHTIREAEWLSMHSHSFILPFKGFSFKQFVQITKFIEEGKEIKNKLKLYTWLQPVAAAHAIQAGHGDLKQNNFRHHYLLDFETARANVTATKTSAATNDYYPIDPKYHKDSTNLYEESFKLISPKNVDLFSLLIIIKNDIGLTTGHFISEEFKNFMNSIDKFITERNSTYSLYVERPSAISYINSLEKEFSLDKDFQNYQKEIQEYYMKTEDNFTFSQMLLKGAYMDTYPRHLFKNSLEKMSPESTSALAFCFEFGMKPSQDILKIFPLTKEYLYPNIRIAYKLYKRAARLGDSMSGIQIALKVGEIFDAFNENDKIAKYTVDDFLVYGQICDGLCDIPVFHETPKELNEDYIKQLKERIDSTKPLNEIEKCHLLEDLCFYFYNIAMKMGSNEAKYHFLMRELRKYVSFPIEDKEQVIYKSITDQLKELNYPQCKNQLDYFDSIINKEKNKPLSFDKYSIEIITIQAIEATLLNF